MSDWISYDNTQQQIDEINKSTLSHGYALRYSNGYMTCKLHTIISLPLDDKVQGVSGHLPSHYLICDPHPIINVMYQQATLGCPVYLKSPWSLHNMLPTQDNYECIGTTSTMFLFKSYKPDWYLPNTTYSLNPFEVDDV